MKKFEILWELPECDTEMQIGQILLEKNGANRLDSYWVTTNLQFFLSPEMFVKHNKAKCKKTRNACILTLENSVCPGKPGAPPSTLLPDLRFQVWVQHQCSVSLSHRGGKPLQSLSYQNRGKELALPLLPPRVTDNTHGNSCLWCSLPLPTLYEQNQESREWLLRHFQFCRDLILEFHIFKESSGLLMKFSINTL